MLSGAARAAASTRPPEEVRAEAEQRVGGLEREASS